MVFTLGMDGFGWLDENTEMKLGVMVLMRWGCLGVLGSGGKWTGNGGAGAGWVVNALARLGWGDK